MRLAGKVAAVTGGSRSIGRGIVEAFLKEGARVAFNGRDAETGGRTLAELGDPENTLFVSGDARNSADIRALVEATVEKFGRIDIMVNNAGGITEPAPIATLSDEAWANDIQWNLSSVFYGIKHAVVHMVPQKFRSDHQHLLGRRKAGQAGDGGIRRVEARGERSDQERRRRGGTRRCDGQRDLPRVDPH